MISLETGLKVHTIAVRELPPKEGCNIRVSLLSLNGTWPLACRQ